MKRQVAIAMAVAMWSIAAFAHGGEQHVMGTVAAIGKDSITVKTTKGEQQLAVTDKTTFENSGKAAKLEDLKVGDRVVIHAMKMEGKLMAHVVRFGATKAATTQKHSHTP